MVKYNWIQKRAQRSVPAVERLASSSELDVGGPVEKVESGSKTWAVLPHVARHLSVLVGRLRKWCEIP